MYIIEDLRNLWNDLKTWKKVFLVVVSSLICLIFILAYFNIIPSVWILWGIFIIICIYLGLKKKSK